MLRLERKSLYQVKAGQTLVEIAETFCVSARVLAQVNGLKEEPKAGDVLYIPMENGNLYTVREGDSKSLLCGSEEKFVQKNGTSNLYLGMRVVL